MTDSEPAPGRPPGASKDPRYPHPVPGRPTPSSCSPSFPNRHPAASERGRGRFVRSLKDNMMEDSTVNVVSDLRYGSRDVMSPVKRPSLTQPLVADRDMDWCRSEYHSRTCTCGGQASLSCEVKVRESSARKENRSLRHSPFRIGLPVNRPLAGVLLLVGILGTLVSPAVSCPALCSCTPLPIEGVSISCDGAGLSSIPSADALNGIQPSEVIKLDLSNNYLTVLPDYAASHFFNLKELKLSGNKIENIAPKALYRLSLSILLLDNNQLTELAPGSLPTTLQDLSIEDNFFTSLPSDITTLRRLKALNAARNKLTTIRDGDLHGLHDLIVLSLHQNKIKTIEPKSLAKLKSLEILDLTENRLTSFPEAVLHCTELKQILIRSNRIKYMGEDNLRGLVNLEQVDLQGNPILTVHRKAFEGLPALTKLILKEARNLTEFPFLNGTSNLDLIRIERSALTSIPNQLCDFTPKLRSLVLHRNKISEIPDLNNCKDLRLLDLETNNIASIGSELFWGLSNLQDLLLHNNHIGIIAQDALAGLGQLQFLNLENNQISQIDPSAFQPLKSLKELNLANNIFPNIPSAGLQGIEVIKVHNNRYLRNFPGPKSFPVVQFLYLSYAYHCCPFLSLEEEQVEEQPVYGEAVIDSEEGIKGLGTLDWNVSTNWTAQVAEPAILSSPYSSTPSPMEIHPTDQGSVFSPNAWEFSRHARQSRRIVQCIPKPGPFMPCKDLFDWWTLRCGVWIVFLLALLGNGTVVFVLIFARTKMDVPRFLVCNLAMADFFMGIYLGFLAVADASTLGKFRMYAIPWQMSSACQIAGFVGVLSSELSVYTLAVITMERNYAITHAMHLNKRLSLKHAAYIMTVGWIFALAMAVLPLTGVSDYRKFAVCLPFETSGAGLGYVVFLMFINGVAFLILMGCYLKMYCAIRGSQAWNSNDSRIAKRMALLVFTDLICWAPIAFFSLTAAFGLHLISLEEAKVFTVFILPLNSCCNPFLYAILTKQFKKDCVMLCKAIEESRVTRGIGRCRHSSNFSNRQTPANTNSALEHSSRDCSQACSCSTKRSDQSKNLRRWRLSALKYLLCHKDHEELNSSSDYSYQTSKTNPKDKRHASVSSDNFSSSRSDSWQRGHATLSLRLLERKRRPSWHLTRKPSQESNLSSSRNDSSITTASTSTWRMSRSSVSSDASNPGSRPVVKADSQTSLRLGPARGRGTEMRPPGPTRQMSQGQLTGKQITIPHNPRSESLNRTKPKLQRQEAVERETYLPNKNGGATPPEDLGCPLHRNDRLTCVYEQESCEDDDQMRHEPSKAYLAPNYQLMGLSVGFVPRKLSTISSHSVSVSKDPEREESKSARGSSTDIRIAKDPESSSLQACPSAISSTDLPRNLKCASLTLLPQTQSPIVALRFPSDNHLTSKIPRRGEAVLMIDTDTNSRTPRDIEVFRHLGEPSLRKEVVTLITGDDDDEVFLDEAPAPLETHFPIEGDAAEEVHPLI